MPKTLQVPENAVAPVVATPQTPAAPSKKADQIQNLDWWQTPLKFKRRDVDNLEVDVINSGGADKLYQQICDSYSDIVGRPPNLKKYPTLL